MEHGTGTKEGRAGTRIGPDRARLPTTNGRAPRIGERRAGVRIEGEPRDLRRILESLERVMDGLDEFTQRKVRILVGELVAQSRYAGHPPRISLGMEIADDEVEVEISGLNGGNGAMGEHDALLSEWSRWLVESITDGYSRSGGLATFVIERRRDA